MINQPKTDRHLSDKEIRDLWMRAIRLSRPWRGRLAHRLAFDIADQLEAAHVTEEDIDRVMGSGSPGEWLLERTGELKTEQARR